ncbi:protein-disulfide reductase DsbD [Tranquillimonas alkanivorans]|uniref:Thiol:disulfide interchange protein DsbD n=1 Tax=Tranquillimonas alkanivorans TaxID=441119 RepID=A0A1I5UCV4_9RHOB|nr:protein-disulfide reductase DsbD [Tranquillimonas alkanivorans]SFP93069.1 thiol:disulfide interchange protein DsbD [Tranquillimonas alkanivorans]
MKRRAPYSSLYRHAIGEAFRTLAMLLLLTGVAAAQETVFAQGEPMDPREAFELTVTAPPEGGRLLRWKIAEGYYLYRDYLSAKTADGASLPLETDQGVAKEDPTFGTVEVYYDSAEARMPAAAGPVQVTYQGCQEDGICYPPVTEELPALSQASSWSATNAPAGEPPVGGDASAPPAEPGEADAETVKAGTFTLADDAGMLGGLRDRGGATRVLLGFFGFGLLLAFTPCVLPMFPILAGLLAGQGEGMGARRGFALSAVYVVAMASALSLLGIVAAWSGQNLQIVLQSPWAVGAVAVIFVALALSMFGLYDLRLPEAWNASLSGAGSGRRGTFGGAAVLGFTSALIMGPCVTAPLAGALLYIAQTGDVALGAGALFALGLGQGVPLLAMGAFGARVLPRAGAWMDRVKLVFGFAFLAMAAWLAGRIVPPAAGLALWAALLVLAGVFAGGLDRLDAASGAGARMRKAAGLVALLSAALLGLGAASGGDDPLRPLAGLRVPAGGSAEAGQTELVFTTVTTVPELEAVLGGSDAPTMIYFTADWCVTCRVIERRVWSDRGVQEALSGMTVIAADLSDFDAGSQNLLDQLNSVGPPTMIFLDARGREAAGTRLVGEPGPEDVIASVRAVR